MDAQKTQLEAAVAPYEQQEQELVKQFSVRQTELNQLLDQIALAQAQREDIQQEIKSLSDRYQVLSAETSDLQSKISDLQQQHGQLQQPNTDHPQHEASAPVEARYDALDDILGQLSEPSPPPEQSLENVIPFEARQQDTVSDNDDLLLTPSSDLEQEALPDVAHTPAQNTARSGPFFDGEEPGRKFFLDVGRSDR